MGQNGGCQSGRRGCGDCDRFSRSNQHNPTANKNKTLKDHFFYVGLNKHASDCGITYEFLLNRIKRTCTRGNDVSETL